MYSRRKNHTIVLEENAELLEHAKEVKEKSEANQDEHAVRGQLLLWTHVVELLHDEHHYKTADVEHADALGSEDFFYNNNWLLLVISKL